MINVLIVDDEELARDELNYLLKKFNTLNVIGEAKNIDEAEIIILEKQPDVVFLDIKMPGGDGFELLERLTFTPLIVFVTAYDQYAIKAFEVNALDYLTKPIDNKRLCSVIDKCVTQTNERAADKAKAQFDPNAKVFLKEGEQCWFVRLTEVHWFESIGNYSRVHFANGKPMIKRTLNHLEERLPKTVFFRANRHSLVNVNSIEQINALDLGMLELILIDGNRIEVSRRKARDFRELNAL